MFMFGMKRRHAIHHNDRNAAKNHYQEKYVKDFTCGGLVLKKCIMQSMPPFSAHGNLQLFCGVVKLINIDRY